MAYNPPTTLSADLESYFVERLQCSSGAVWFADQQKSKNVWQPIQYTSLAGWMFMNYLLLAALITFVGVIGYVVWSWL